jgi:nucleotide-binding universal stress UspA family protein
MALMFKKILVPIDLMEPKLAEVGIYEAIALARLSQGMLRILYVQFFTPPAYADYVPTNFGDQLRLAAEQRVSEVGDRIDYPQERVSTIVRFGSVYREVLTESDEWGADLIVVGSHRPSMAAFFLGANASVIVSHAKCSVFVVRQ